MLFSNQGLYRIFQSYCKENIILERKKKSLGKNESQAFYETKQKLKKL